MPVADYTTYGKMLDRALTNRFAYPTLVVSVFSMNVHIPLQEMKHSFWLILTLAAISVYAVIFWWRRGK